MKCNHAEYTYDPTKMLFSCAGCLAVRTNLSQWHVPKPRLNSVTPAEWDASTNPTYVQPENAPVPNELPACWDLVMQDMRSRDKFGKEKYGVRLQPENGRDFLVDAYQEALDLTVYLRGLLYERDKK